MKTCTSVFVFLVFFTAFAEAAIVPPPGFDSWIWHAGSYCSSPHQSLAECAGSASGFLPPIDRAHPDHDVGTKHIGGGSASANQLTAYYESNRLFQKVFVSIRDVYTVAGPPGEIDLPVRLSAEAQAMRILPFGSPTPVGSVKLSVSIGTGIETNGRTLVNGLAFDADELPSGSGPLSDLLFAEATAVRMITVNQPFALAFQMVLEGTSGALADARNTAIIDFDIPDGYTLTSELGWTPVPVPAPFVLLGTGFVALLRLARSSPSASPDRRPATHYPASPKGHNQTRHTPTH